MSDKVKTIGIDVTCMTDSAITDIACKRMERLFSLHKVKMHTMVAAVDGFISGNNGEPVELAIVMGILSKTLGEDFFLANEDYREEEVIDWLDALSVVGILERHNKHLIKFRDGLDTSLLLKSSLEQLEKVMAGKFDCFEKWLGALCGSYSVSIKSDAFKRFKEERKRDAP